MDPSSCATLRYTKSTIVIFLLLLHRSLSQNILPSILWSTDNIFYRNIGDQARTVFLKDRITFICQDTVHVSIKRNVPLNKDVLYANIYMVDKQGYDSCDSNRGLKILICDKPTELKYQDVLINDNAAVAGIPIFNLGKTNYFIDTSSGTENTINNRTGGRCKTHNMKMKIYVCTNSSDPKCPNGNEERTSVADTLGTLSVGAVVAIFLAIFIVGCVLGLIVGVLGTHKKLKQFVVKRRPGRSNNNGNRNSFASTANFRPTSFASILSSSTGITNFDTPVENDNFTRAESGVI